MLNQGANLVIFLQMSIVFPLIFYYIRFRYMIFHWKCLGKIWQKTFETTLFLQVTYYHNLLFRVTYHQHENQENYYIRQSRLQCLLSYRK